MLFSLYKSFSITSFLWTLFCNFTNETVYWLVPNNPPGVSSDHYNQGREIHDRREHIFPPLFEFSQDKKDELQVRLDHSVSTGWHSLSKWAFWWVSEALHSSLHGWPQSDQPARFSGTTSRQAGARCRLHRERLVINVTPGLTPDVGSGSAKRMMMIMMMMMRKRLYH